MVVHIVGIETDDDYLPMMWETFWDRRPDAPVFDFKYLRGRNPFGLNKPPIFERADLKKLFALYCDKAGAISFP